MKRAPAASDGRAAPATDAMNGSNAGSDHARVASRPAIRGSATIRASFRRIDDPSSRPGFLLAPYVARTSWRPSSSVVVRPRARATRSVTSSSSSPSPSSSRPLGAPPSSSSSTSTSSGSSGQSSSSNEKNSSTWAQSVPGNPTQARRTSSPAAAQHLAQRRERQSEELGRVDEQVQDELLDEDERREECVACLFRLKVPTGGFHDAACRHPGVGSRVGSDLDAQDAVGHAHLQQLVVLGRGSHPSGRGAPRPPRRRSRRGPPCPRAPPGVGRCGKPKQPRTGERQRVEVRAEGQDVICAFGCARAMGEYHAPQELPRQRPAPVGRAPESVRVVQRADTARVGLLERVSPRAAISRPRSSDVIARASRRTSAAAEAIVGRGMAGPPSLVSAAPAIWASTVGGPTSAVPAVSHVMPRFRDRASSRSELLRRISEQGAPSSSATVARRRLSVASGSASRAPARRTRRRTRSADETGRSP